MESNVQKPKVYANDIKATKAINLLSGKLAWKNRNKIKLIRNTRNNMSYVKVMDITGKETISPIYKWSRVSLTAVISASLIIGVGALTAKAVQAKTLPEEQIRYEKSIYQNEPRDYYLTLKDKQIVQEIDKPIFNEEQSGFDPEVVNFKGEVARNATLTAVESDSCEQAKYDKIIENLKPYCEKYGSMYGVDPNLLAALMMTEAGGNEFDISKDNKYSAIGYLQLNGNIWNGEEIKVYDFIDKCDKVYTINAGDIMGNSEEQVKCFAIMLQDYARKDNYNVCAMIEEHNKGCGTLEDALSTLKGQYPGKDSYTLLADKDASLVESTINKSIGDGEYYNKTMGYMKMLLDNHEFGDKNYITIYDKNSNEYNYSVNIVPSRSR